jgi:CRP-like cAMP-binding protein
VGVTRLDALRAVRELAACSDRDISSLLRYTDEVKVERGELMAERGRQCAAFVVVMEGRLRSDCGPLSPGDSHGWNEMWERAPNHATVVAETDARILVVSHEQFRAVKGLSGIQPPASHEGEAERTSSAA